MTTQKQIIAHLAEDPVLAPVVKEVPYPTFTGDGNVYGSLLRSIVSQQLSVQAASTIYERFLGLFDGMEPPPDVLAGFPEADLRTVGISRQKATYLQSVANHFSQTTFSADYWLSKDDESIIDELTGIKGVGPWTVQMVLMFTLDRPNVFPVGDLGIRQAIIDLYKLDTNRFSKRKELDQHLEKIAEPWRPYRTIACKYLWKYRSGK